MLRHPLVKFVLVLIALGVLFQLAIQLAPERYSIAERPAGMAVAYRDDESFVFVNVDRIGRRTSSLAHLLPGAMRMMTDLPQILPGTAVAYRMSGGKLERYELAGAGAGANYGLDDGRMTVMWRDYFTQSWLAYRWDGAEFAKLTSDEAERLSGSVPSFEEGDDPIALLQREREMFAGAGWNFDRMPLTGSRERRLKFPAADGEMTLLYGGSAVVEDGDDNDWLQTGPASVELSGPGINAPGTKLYETAGDLKPISKQEFLALIPEQMRGSALQRPSLLMGPLMLIGALFSNLFHLIWFLPWLLPMWWMFGYRRRTLRTLAGTYDFQPAAPSEYAGLDHAALERHTGELQSLGFRQVRDFTVVPDLGKYDPDFSRLFLHPEHHCFAQVVQLFPHKGKPRPMTVVLHSMFENDWSVSTAPAPTPALTYRARLPQSLWFCMPGATPAQLREAHLARREEVTRELGTGVFGNLNFAAYQSYALGRFVERRQALRKRGLFFGPREALVLRLRPPQEWRGALGSRRPA